MGPTEVVISVVICLLGYLTFKLSITRLELKVSRSLTALAENKLKEFDCDFADYLKVKANDAFVKAEFDEEKAERMLVHTNKGMHRLLAKKLIDGLSEESF